MVCDVVCVAEIFSKTRRSERQDKQQNLDQQKLSVIGVSTRDFARLVADQHLQLTTKIFKIGAKENVSEFRVQKTLLLKRKIQQQGTRNRFRIQSVQGEMKVMMKVILSGQIPVVFHFRVRSVKGLPLEKKKCSELTGVLL